jgi:hypothetical protein
MPRGTVHLESEQFDREWRVTCDDEAFAFRFVTPPVMELLLDNPARLEGVEVYGTSVLVYRHLCAPEEVPALIAAIGELARRIPRSLSIDYALGPQH